MSSFTQAHAHALMAGLIVGAGYYVAARAMQVAATRFVGRAMIAAVLGGFLVRLLCTSALLWTLVQAVHLPVGALCVGFLTAYNVVFAREVFRQRRKTAAPAGRAEQT